MSNIDWSALFAGLEEDLNMSNAEEATQQKQLPLMPSQVGDHILLGIPEKTMHYILDYINMDLKIENKSDNRLIFMDIMSLLTIRDDDTAMLRLASRHMMNAISAYTSYAEMFIGKGE